MPFTDDRDSDIAFLERTAIYRELATRAACEPGSPESAALLLVRDVAKYAVQRTKLIVIHMRQYTLHDADHLFRVVVLMERLIPSGTLALLSTPELLLLLCSAFLHDIGMAPSDREVTQWRAVWNASTLDGPSLTAPDPETERFRVFIQGRRAWLEELGALRAAGENAKANLAEDHLVSEYTRYTHADRAIGIIESEWASRLTHRDSDLAGVLARICFSHNSDALDLLKEDDSKLCGPEEYLCIPFVGVVLRLADLLDFDAKRTPDVLFAHLGVRHHVSLSEWKKHRSVDAWVIRPTEVAFSAECVHPAVELAIKKFCDMIDHELAGCQSVLRNLSFTRRADDSHPSHYLLKLPPRVDRSRIGPKLDVRGRPAYQYKDCQFTLERRQVIDLLMGTKLYGDPSVALRELLQNSIDACGLRLAREGRWGNHFEPIIEVVLERGTGPDSLIVRDNGAGMDEDIVSRFLSRVGSSYYRSTDFLELRARERLEVTPISKFGIGILSCFMVADSFTFHTRRLLGAHESSDPIEVRVEGLDAVFWFAAGNRAAPGTDVQLLLRPQHPWRWLSDSERMQRVIDICPNPPFPIQITCGPLSVRHTKRDMERAFARMHTPISNANMRVIHIALGSASSPFCGEVFVGILQRDGRPVSDVEVFRETVTVAGRAESYEMTTLLRARTNKISRVSDQLQAKEDGFDVQQMEAEDMSSHSAFSVQGIEVPMKLFVHPWEHERQPTNLQFPFPAHLVVDVAGGVGLSLNAARSLVLADERWFAMVTLLATEVVRGIRTQVSAEFWSAISELWLGNGDFVGTDDATRQAFLAGLHANL
ncbi:MAG: ATP-binding protein [Pseudomonadota bacterium]|nr:ATP-binding protein [Pseudomonadota bacterium]